MTEPQIWTLMVGFFAIFVATLTVLSTLLTRVIHAEISGLRGEMNARFDVVEAKFETVDVRFEAVNEKFESMSQKIEGLDRDVQTLMKREFGR